MIPNDCKIGNLLANNWQKPFTLMIEPLIPMKELWSFQLKILYNIV